MKVLILGSGAREHALALAIAKSPQLEALFVAPGNPGCAAVADARAPRHPSIPRAIASFCEANAIDLVVVGPEAPLVAGVADDLAAAGSPASGRAAPPRSSKVRRASPRISVANSACRPATTPISRSRRGAGLCRREGRADRRQGGRIGGGQGRRRRDDARRGRGGGAIRCSTALSARPAPRSSSRNFSRGEEVSFFAIIDGARAIAVRQRTGPQARRRRRHGPEHRRHGRLFAAARDDAGARATG